MWLALVRGSKECVRTYNIKMVFKSGTTLLSFITKVIELLTSENQVNNMYNIYHLCALADLGVSWLEAHLKELRNKYWQHGQKTIQSAWSAWEHFNTL